MDQVKIGAFIAKLRLEQGWTQEELGERLRRWFGRYWTSLAAVLVLCIFLGISIYVDWQYRQAHPEDVSTELATFMYRAG